MTSDTEFSTLVEEEPTEIPILESKEPIITEEETNVTVTEEIIITEKIIETTEPITEKSVTEYIVEEQKNFNINQQDFSIPQEQTGFKSYLPHKCISKGSPDYNMISTMGHVDDNGLWKISEYYCIAMGSYYSKRLGNVFEIELDNGNIFKAIIVCHKSDLHTDYTHRYTMENKCITEFVVDYENLNPTIKFSGSVGAINEFNGLYTRITFLYNIYD